jgi:hypothetical protein
MNIFIKVKCHNSPVVGFFFSSSHAPQELNNKMGRMHAPGKGISSSALPYRRTAPSWMKTAPAEVVDQICKLAKKGLTPSQIGVVLRYAASTNPQVHFIN